MKVCPLCKKPYDTGDTCPEDGATLIDPKGPKDPLIGTILKNSYKIEEKIGSGGMGAVYRAVQNPLGRTVAVKVIHPNLQSESDVLERFYREAKLTSQLNHPNIVGLIDFGNTESGMLFMVMEFLEGKTLKERVPKKEGLPVEEIVEIMNQICAGISAAHHLRLIHRDLKPDNIFLADIAGGQTVAKVLDFGIARGMDDDVTRLTAQNVSAGTPGFLAPEQFEDVASADERSDIYALGAVLYFLIAGVQPFSGRTTHTVVFQQLNQEPDKLDFAKLGKPKELEKVYLKALHRSPKKRYQTPSELMHALFEAAGVSKRPTIMPETPTVMSAPRRKPLPIIGGIAALALLVFGIWFFLPENEASSGRIFRGVDAGTIKLGITAAFSGPAKELGREMKTGILTYLNVVNDKGGIHGRKFELIERDDGYEPEQALKNAEDLLLKDQVFAMVGNVGTPTAKVVVPFAVDHQFILFGAFTGAGLLRKDPPDRYVFNYRASYVEETSALVRYFVGIRKVKPEEIAVFLQDDSYGAAGFEGVKRTLRKDHNIDERDILQFRYERNTTHVETAVADTLKHRDRVKAVIIVGTYKAAAKYIHLLRKEKMESIFANVSFVGSRALAEEFAENYEPSDAEGVIVTQVVPHYESKSTGVMRYRKHLNKYFPTEEPGFVSLEGYIAASILVAAIEKAGPELSTEKLVEALESIKDLDLGFGTAIHFGPSDHQGSDKVWGTVLDAGGRYSTFPLD